MGAAPRRVVVAANSSWNIVNFRAGLIRALERAGYEPVVVAPLDAAAEPRMAELRVERIGGRHRPLGPQSARRLAAAARLSAAPATPAPGRVSRIYDQAQYLRLHRRALARHSGDRQHQRPGTAFIRPRPAARVVTRLYRVALSRVAVVFFQNPDDRELFVERAHGPAGSGAAAARLGRRSRQVRARAAAVRARRPSC